MSKDGSMGFVVLLIVMALFASDARYNSTPEGKREVRLRSIRNRVRHIDSPEAKQQLKDFETDVIKVEMQQFLKDQSDANED